MRMVSDSNPLTGSIHPEQPKRLGGLFREGRLTATSSAEGLTQLPQGAASDPAAPGFAEAGLRKTGI
jgi:hypothetical protein